MIQCSEADFTHKGWFFMCPIYLNADDGEGMSVAARWECLEWWFTVNAFICDCVNYLLESINPEYEPHFPFRVTGKTNR
jgi:hypothetical protein